MGNLIKIPV